MLLRLAFRNLWRHRGRTWLSVGALAFSLMLMITLTNFQYGVWVGILETAIQNTAGHVMVEAEGWRAEQDPELVVERSGEVAELLGRVHPEATVVRRAEFGGLLTSPTGSVAVTVRGIEPGPEAAVGNVDERIVEGAWLEEDDERGVILGDDLADRLGVELGDKVVLMAQAGGDEMQSRLLRVRGLIHSGSEMLDSFTALTTLPSAQTFLQGEDPAMQVAGLIDGVGRGTLDTTPLATAVEQDLPDAGLAVLTWRDALPLLEDQMEMDMAFNTVLYGFVGLIVVVGVLNTLLMSVMERLKEFGVMLAVGMRPRDLASLVVLEGGLVGLLGATVGLGLGGLATWPLVTQGVDYGELMAESSPVAGIALDSTLYALPDWGWTTTYVVMAVLCTTLASAWPAWRALALHPVEAMRNH